MGCGKTTVGKLAAKKMGISFFDSDDLIIDSQGMTIPEIFARKGEPYFRKTEADIIKSLCGKKAVVACGGGAMLNPDTAAAASSSGEVIFLDVDFESCYERICGDSNRPIAASSTKEELKERFNLRRDIYLKHSTIHIDSSDSPMRTVELITEAIKFNRPV